MKIIKPNMYVKSIIDIPYEDLITNGIKLICFDLDNTLDIPNEETILIDPTIESKLIEIENMGLEIFIISNNTIENRVESFAKKRGYNYLKAARKPFQRKYKENTILKQYEKKEIIFIGDKIITDIIGARLYGSPCILVDQIVNENLKYYSKIMSVIENVFCKISGFKKGEYFDYKM